MDWKVNSNSGEIKQLSGFTQIKLLKIKIYPSMQTTTTVNQVNSVTETTTSVETQTQTQTQNQTVISTQIKTESQTDTQISKITTSTPSFLYPVTILGFITVGVAVVLRRSKRKIK